eukprot:gene18077-24500_t
MRSRLLAAALAWLLLVRADVFAQDTLNGPIGDNLELAAPDRVNLEGTESDMSPWGADSALPTAPPPQSIRDGLSLEEQKQGVGSYTWTMSPPTHPPSLACEMDNLDDLQKLALLLFYYNTGGTSGGWTVDSGWRESWKENEANLEKTTANNTCNWSDKQLSLRGLPDYCCWFGVTCCLFPFCPSSDLLDRVLCGCHVGSVALLELPNNNLTGSLTAPDSEADTVDLLLYLSCAMARLILNSNHLVGTIPGLFSEFQALEVLSLGNNNLTGSIPMELGNVRQLQELELTNNRLTGVVPQSFCGHVDSYARENMVDMLIRGNLVIADLPRHACHGLVFFAAQAFPNLHILRLMDNLLNGSIPSSIGDSRVLVDLDLSKNFITGSIPEKITNLVYLSSLRLDGNVFLSGTIPPTIFERLLSLSSLSCSHCNLSGTLPDTIGQSYALASLNLLGNSLSGTLPDSISKLYYAQVDLVENFLSCCGVGPVVNGRYESYNFSRPRLPSGIRLSDVFTTPQYRPDVNGNNMLKEMSCPALELYSAVDDLDPYSYAYPTLLEWSIDPEYFLFEGCTCGQGLSLTNSSPVEHEIAFLCLPTPVSAPNYSWVIGAVVPGVILIFMLLLCLPLARKGGRLLFVQAALNLRKRLKGIPMTGTISVVVTDIEGYSDLMQRCPELMTPALLQHNQAVRVCKWDNFGFTVEQEGDSYTLVFYEAMDAVKFCMQAQLLLMEQDWHEALTMEVFPEMIQPPNATPIVSIDSVKGLASKLSQKVGLTNVSPASSGMVPDMSRHVSSAGTPIDSSSASFDSKAVKNLRPSSPPCTNNPLSRGVKSTRALESLDEGAEIPHDPSSMIHSTPGSNPSTKKGPIKGLFRGLRVRMGVATGELLPGGMAQGGEVMERAKVVSDAGAGGQVLMDKRTFNGIKNHLEELGAISHTGVHYKLSSLLPRYFAMCSGKSSRSLAEATVLDMGKYIGVSHESKPPDPQGTLDNINKKDSHTWGQPPSFPREQMKKSWHLSSLLGLNSDTAGDMDVSFNSNRLESHLSALPLTRLMPQNYSPRGGLPTHYSHQSMQLFQILPPALVGRAKVFLNTLVLKDDWVDVALASLGSSDVVPQKPLPSVTVVHCVVESAKRYATFFPSDCRKVASSCESVIHLTLKHFDDGYLSQAQTKNLTYIVVFKSVETALTWCLVAQECLMYVDWPASALEFWKEEDVKTEEMGVCEGVPRDIHPDRNGRPVYVATFINLAARIACTAAAGGQIVCDAHLARKAAAAWGEQTEKDAVSFDNCTMGQKSVPLRILGGISRASAGARASVGAGVVHASKLSGSVQDSIHSAVSFATSSCSAGAKTGYSGASTGQTTDAHLEVTDSSFSLPHLPSTPELAKPTWNLGDLMSLPSQPISASARSDVSAQTTSSDLIEVTASLPTPTTTPSKGTAKTSSPMPTTTTTQGLPTTPPEDPTTTATNNYYNNSRGPTTTSSRGRTTTPHQDPTTAPALGGEAHLGIRTGDFHFCEEVDSPMLPHPLQLSAMHQAAAPGGRGETDTTSSTNGVDSVLTPHPSQGSSMYRVSAMTDPVSNSVDQASAPGDRGGHEETSFSNGMDSTTPHPSQGSSMCQASAMTYQVSTSVDEVPVPANVDNPTRAGRVQSPTAEKTTGKEASGRTSSDYGLDKRSFELAKEQAGAWRISEVEIDSFAGRMNSEQAKAVAVRRQLEAVKASLDGESMLSGLPNSNYRKATVPPVFSTIPSLDLAGGREPNKLIKVHIIELGSYKIKGASAPMPLVQVVSDILRGRKFPVSTKSQPACLVPASALLLSTDVQLGDAVSVFKLLRAAQ